MSYLYIFPDFYIKPRSEEITQTIFKSTSVKSTRLLNFDKTINYMGNKRTIPNITDNEIVNLMKFSKNLSYSAAWFRQTQCIVMMNKELIEGSAKI